jgi:hypothetical protein
MENLQQQNTKDNMQEQLENDRGFQAGGKRSFSIVIFYVIDQTL